MTMMINKIKNTHIYNVLKKHYKYSFKIKPNLTKQLNTSHFSLNVDESFTKRRVLITQVETSHYFNYLLLIIGKALELRGATVYVLVCDQSLNGCEIKSIRNKNSKNNCFNCVFNLNKLIPFFKFKIITIHDLFNNHDRDVIRSNAKLIVESNSTITYKDFSLDRAINDSIVRYYYGAVPLNEADYKDIKINHTETSMLALDLAYKLDELISPDVVLGSMSCYSAFDPISQYYKKNGDRFRLISLNPYDFSKITLDISDLYYNNRFERYFNYRNKNILTSDENDILNEFLNKRLSGEAEIFKKEGYFDSKSKIEIEKKLRIRKDVKNIFLFSNIYWDVGISDLSILYPDVITWVLDTIEMLKNDSEVHLYIKPHPGEVFDGSSSLKGISEIIKDNYPNLPLNVTIIEPSFKIKTYDLFEFIDVGVVFTGTLAIEMMLSGLKVITVGRSPYEGLGFSDVPKSKEDYLYSLKHDTINKINMDFLKMFSFFYFIKSSIPFNLTDKVYGIDFVGYNFNSLSDLEYGKNQYLDHICEYIIDKDSIIPDSW